MYEEPRPVHQPWKKPNTSDTPVVGTATPLVPYPDTNGKPLPSEQPQAANEPVPLVSEIQASRAQAEEAFKQDVIRLFNQCQLLYDMPLDVLLIMVMRNAVNHSLPGNGRMGVYGGISNFTPTPETFARWFAAYFEEIKRREAAAGPAEV